MSEWKEFELGEVINLKRGYDLPNGSRKFGIYPVISSSGTSDYHSDFKKIGPSVVTGRYGTLGTFYYVKNFEKYWPLNTTLYVEDFKGNSPRFIYYFLQTLSIERFGQKSAVPGLNRNELHQIKVTIPDIIHQRKIAKTLSTIDSKIALLNQQNKTLEELAQTLFKCWFEDYEFPNDNRQPYKSSGGKLIESELGVIPEEWRIGMIKELIDIPSGYPFKSNNFTIDGKFKLITIKNVQDGYIDSSKTERISNVPLNVKEYCLLKTGDVLISLTGNVGRVGLVCEDNLLLNQRVGLCRPKNKNNNPFTYLFFRKKEIFNQINSIARGTAQANLSPIETQLIEIIIPSDEVLDAFSRVTIPIFNHFIGNNKEIQSLTQLRDTLLPKLMSGEIQIN